MTRKTEELQALSRHLLYEGLMLFRLADRLRGQDNDTARLPWEVEMACIEAFALHARVLTEFFWGDPKPQFPKDGFAVEFFAPGDWARLRKRVQRSKLDQVPRRTGTEIAHLSYSRTEDPDVGRDWEFDVIAGVIGMAFRVFLENVEGVNLIDDFEPRLRATWPTYLNLPIGISFPPDSPARTVATSALRSDADYLPASFEDLL